MTYNIWDLKGRRPAVKDVVEVIRSGGVPDLVLLQEVRGKRMAFSLSEALGLPYCVYHGFNKRSFGVAIVSRYPLTESGFLGFKASKMNRGALKAVMMVKGRKVRVCSVHLDRVESIKVNPGGVDISWGNALNLLTREMSEETVRSRSVDELLAWMGSEGEGRVIIGGDFNTVLFSKGIRRMGTVYEDALWNMPDYFTGSYIKSTLPVDPRLDFLFYSKDLECLRGSVVRRTAGDHYPVRAAFVSPQRRRGR
jgi:endonuclease/exonuclease/phosphatase family metal-dependent hydrolase